MNIDFNVNNVTELKKVLSYVEKYHDNIVIVIENDEYECLRVYYDENCQKNRSCSSGRFDSGCLQQQ